MPARLIWRALIAFKGGFAMFRTAIVALALLFTAGAAQAQGAEDRLKKIASTKTITIAYRTDAIPFSYTDDKKQVDGFTIDLCKRVVNSIERQIKVPGLQVKWVPVTSQTRFDTVSKGQADMECGASTATLTRMKQVDFSSYISSRPPGSWSGRLPGCARYPTWRGKGSRSSAALPTSAPSTTS